MSRMKEATGRAARLCDLMNERIRSMPAAERDRMLQQFLAEAKTPSERFRTLVAMIDFVIAVNRVLRKARDG
ncbi:MAG: hypothetical protein JXQ75_12015 [Phycisphaerae bacterium]|nr:hypothetical protein [Phycisphaerae bacterium]